jgi:hypothetical protein
MNISKHLVSVFVQPSNGAHENVISRVIWVVRFEEGGFTSDALVETFLDTGAIVDFIPANQVGNDRVLQWAFDAQGGETFVESVKARHEQEIAYKRSISGHIEYVDGFELMSSQMPRSIPKVVL